MALSPQLLNFKSSGVYRLEFDKSQTTNNNVQTIRLVVGHSKKGPYNTPVFVQTAEEFNAIFGSIDTNLEKLGMFFHRSALAALGRGPILALNIANIDANDTIAFQSPVTNGSVDSISALDGANELSSYFNIDKFWFPEDKAVLDTIGNLDEDRVLNFINIKQEPITVIVRKAQDVTSFEISAREWYGEGNVPAFLNDFDLVSDFMVDVFVFKGKFNPADMNTDPIYGEFFDANGLIKGKLNEFSALRQVTLLAQYTGSLIPNFKDLEGRNLYIEAGINQEARRTGLFCAVNEDLVTDENGTKVDLVGHIYDEAQDYEVLSYVVANDANPKAIAYAGDVYVNSASSFTMTFADALDADAFPIKKGHYVDALASNRLAKVQRVQRTGNVWTVTCSQPVAATWSGFYNTSFEEATVSYKPLVLEKATVASKTIAGSLSQLTGTGLFAALVDKDVIDFRYIVDTFASYEDGSILNKKELAFLAHERQNAAAILNAPMVSDFKKSTDPSFKNDNNEFNVAYIKDGGNLDKNPSALYALPSINDGANYAFYYGPGLLVRENGKDTIVPPAAYVSNNFIDKYF